MTGPNDSEASTRPISVAELLAKNGTIGAAPPGGRRRRRRGNSDAVTVAELTGEIPIVRTGEIPVVEEPVKEEPQADAQPEAPAQEPAPKPVDAEPAARTNGNGSAAAPEARPASRPELADAPVARRGPAVKPERSHFPLVARKGVTPADAETMSPDPVVDDAVDADVPVAETPDTELRAPDSAETEVPDTEEKPDELGIGDASYLQTYLRATSGPLFGGQTVADDLARRGTEDSELAVGDELEVAEALEDDTDEDTETRVDTAGEPTTAEDRPTRGQLAVRGLLIAVQSIVAVAFGAGLFIAFDQLWKWNSIVALILGVLVILGLVVGVRVVRKTEDIGSTLTAVAVGALVTFGPLALLQAS